jgi:hypothetical protein
LSGEAAVGKESPDPGGHLGGPCRFRRFLRRILRPDLRGIPPWGLPPKVAPGRSRASQGKFLWGSALTPQPLGGHRHHPAAGPPPYLTGLHLIYVQVH